VTGIAEKECPAAVPADAFCFVFRWQELLVKSIGEASEIPRLDEVAPLSSTPLTRRHVGAFDERPCFSVELPDGFAAPPGMEFKGLRGYCYR